MCLIESFENVGQNDPAPMIAPIPFGMNSSSSQLLDLLQALRLGQFFFFSLTYFKATHKKKLFYGPSISNPNYLPPPIKNLKPRRHSRTKAMFQKMVL
jgi:hypothetical protein